MHQFAFPPTMQKRSSFSTSSPTSVVAWVVNVRHSDKCKTPLTRCKMVSHCGFDLYFPDDEWCWAFFHVSVGHLNVFFGEVSVPVFCPFLHWIICCLGVEFDKFFIDFGYNSLSDMLFENIFSHSVGRLFVLLMFLCCAEAFYFDEVPIVHFCFCFSCLWRHVE